MKISSLPFQNFERIKHIGDKIYKYTDKLVISFADIVEYAKVCNNLKRCGIHPVSFTEESIEYICRNLQVLNKNWGLKISSCGEKFDLEKYNIIHNRCIDDDLMIDLFPDDKKLMDFLGYVPDIQQNLFGSPVSDERKYMKDKGQREACGCIVSKDIGHYNTCGHLCVYCYANTSAEAVGKIIKLYNPDNESIV